MTSLEATGPDEDGDASEGPRSRLEALARVARERASELYERSPVPHLLLTRSGVIVELNGAAAELLGQRRLQLVGKPLLSVASTSRPLLLAHLQACLQGQATEPLELELAAREGGEPRRARVLGCGVTDLVGHEPLCLLTISAPGPRRPADAALQLLLDVAQRGSTSLDPAQVIQEVAAAVVPELADLCVVDRVDGRELARRAAVRHVDAERGERFARAEERWGVLPNLSFATLQALQTNQPQMIPAMGPTYLETAAVDPEHFTELMGLVLRSWVIVPLQTPEAGVMGALRLGRAGVRPPFDQDDVQLAMRVAELAARGLANAVAHEQARTDGGSRERQAAALARELEDAVRALAHARASLAPRSAAGLDIGQAAERLRVVIRELQGASRAERVAGPPT